MDLQLRGHEIPITDGLRTFVERRSHKLDQLLDRVVDAKLELKTDHNRAGGDVTTAQLTIQTGRNTLRAEERDHDPQKAIDEVIDKMVRQIRRFHDRRTDRKWSRPEVVATSEATATDADLELDGESDGDETDEAVASTPVRTKRFPMKPMHADEAIEQMELLGHDFYLFLNAAEDQLNVIYRRRDGAYGLLAPERR